MFALLLCRGGGGEQIVVVDIRRRDDFGDARFPFRQRAGLIHDEGRHFLHQLDGAGVLDQDTGMRAAAHADHDRHWRGQAERARTRDDQNSNGVDDRVGEARLGTEPDPRDESNQRRKQNRRHEITGDSVRETLDGRAAALRFGNHPHDLGENGFVADALGFHNETAGVVERAANHFVARRFFDGERFAGNHRLVHGGAAFGYAAVDWNFFAGTNAELIAGFHFGERQIAFFSIAHDARGLWCEIEQTTDRVSGAPARAQFQDLADQNQHGDHRGGLEIKTGLLVVRHRVREQAREEKRHATVGPGDADADGDERKHVEMPAN